MKDQTDPSPPTYIRSLLAYLTTLPGKVSFSTRPLQQVNAALVVHFKLPQGAYRLAPLPLNYPGLSLPEWDMCKATSLATNIVR